MNKDVDIAISRIVPNLHELRSFKLLSSQPQLVVHKKFLEAFDLKGLEFNERFLKKTPVMIYDSSAPLLANWLYHTQIPLAQLNVKYIFDDWLSILDLVEAGVGYAVMPNSLMPRSADVVVIPLLESVMPTYDCFTLVHKSSMELPVFESLFAASTRG